MITDLKIIKSITVSQDKNLFDFNPGVTCLPLDRISSISFINVASYGTMESTKLNTVKLCVEFIQSTINQYSLWLFASTASWQRNSPVLNHLKLWGSLKKRGLHIPENENTELTLKSEKGVKFFGCMKLFDSQLADGLRVLAVERMSFLVLLPDSSKVDLNEYIKKGWAFALGYDFSFWTDIISYTCKNNGIFLRVFGVFDDREVGVSAIMPRDIFENNFS